MHPKRLVVDGLSGKTKMILTKRPLLAGALCSIVYSRGKRMDVVSFPSDYALHSRRAVELWNERPLRLNGAGVDSLRKNPAISSQAASVRNPFVFPTIWTIGSVEAEFVRFGKDLSAGFSGFKLGISFPDFGRISFPTVRLSPERAMYAPLLGAVVLGMGSALFIEHSLGSGVHAGEANVVVVERPAPVVSAIGAEMVASSVDSSVAAELGSFTAKDVSQEKFEQKVREMVKGYPIEEMLPYIFEKDRLVATFLIAIGKKESAWGVHVPVLDDQDCFNYWGFRGQRRLMGTGGHTCFNSRKDAVDTVAKRLSSLIHDSKLDTPKDLILWKCGFSCAGHSPYSVQKWIADVDLYYQELNKGE